MKLRSAIIALLSLGMLCQVEVPQIGWLQEALTPFAAPDLPEIRAEVAAIQQELSALPPHVTGGSGVRRGFHSTYTPIPRKPFWIIVDLGRSYPIDLVALIPTDGPMTGSMPGYGFPRRFQVDLSEDSEFEEFVTIAREMSPAYPNPGPYPYVAEAGGRRARYVRLYAATRWQQDRRIWMIAVGEIFVISGGMNVARGARVETFANLSTQHEPIWMAENLVDGQSNLGVPIGSRPSRTHGFCSQPAARSDALTWVQVDLQAPVPVDEVRLFPAHPHDSPVPGYGFPLRFRVEASLDGSFRNPAVCASYEDEDFLNPGDNVVPLPAEVFPPGTCAWSPPSFMPCTSRRAAISSRSRNWRCFPDKGTWPRGVRSKLRTG